MMSDTMSVTSHFTLLSRYQKDQKDVLDQRRASNIEARKRLAHAATKKRTEAIKPPKKKKIPAKLLASIPIDNTICRLLDLPPELRTRIYEYVLAPKKSKSSPRKRLTITKDNFSQPPLLRTCKTIRNEASSIYYFDTPFNFHIHDYDSSLLQAFCKQAGDYRFVQKVDIKLTFARKSQSWGNLMVWCRAFFEDRVRGVSCEDNCTKWDAGCCRASMAFDLVDRVMGEGLVWEKVVPLLEVLKKATERRKRGLCVWT